VLFFNLWGFFFFGTKGGLITHKNPTTILSLLKENQSFYLTPNLKGETEMKANRVYSKDKVTFLDIIEPYINGKIEEIINSRIGKSTNNSSHYKGSDVI
jgi:hypothetical protein